MDDRQTRGTLSIAPVFGDFVEQELLPAIGLKPDVFWSGLESIIADLTPTNRSLLAVRDEMQKQIDECIQHALSKYGYV